MNKSIYLRQFQPPLGVRRQSGATLIIVLILLILITLFGIASVRSSLLQERMVSGTISNNAAFQGTEAGLRQGEIFLAGLSSEDIESKFPPTSNTCNEEGFCSKYVPVENPVGGIQPIPKWALSEFWEETNISTHGKPIIGKPVGKAPFDVTPKYVIEDFGKGESGNNTATDRGTAFEPAPAAPPKLYRITAYAKAPGTDAETILQSIYIR